MSLWSKIGRYLPNRAAKFKPGFAGRDLQGNTYFEIINPNGGRAKRTVEYIETGNDPLDYRSGTQQLPVQWTAWMSHTRLNPPTMAELQADANRQAALRNRVAFIEARERAERIEQGYLREDGSEIGSEQVPDRLKLGEPVYVNEKVTDGESGKLESSKWSTGTGGVPHSGARFAFPPRERDDRRAARFARLSEAEVEPESEGQKDVEAERKPQRIAQPAPKVDALSQDPGELRRLAEEDTRRRMRESGVDETTEGKKVEQAAFAPRKRGKK